MNKSNKQNEWIIFYNLVDSSTIIYLCYCWVSEWSDWVNDMRRYQRG